MSDTNSILSLDFVRSHWNGRRWANTTRCGCFILKAPATAPALPPAGTAAPSVAPAVSPIGGPVSGGSSAPSLLDLY